MSLLAIHTYALELIDRHVLGMAEMGYNGLSEQWLLRRAGDLHWRLIARAMGQKDAVFTCPDGQPLYAAFCVTSLRMNSPEMPRLGDDLTLSAELCRIGQSRLASIQKVSVEGRQIGRVILSLFETDTTGLRLRSMVRGRWESVRVPSVVLPDGKASLFSGNVEVPIDDSWEGQGRIEIRHAGPTPCTIRALTPVFDAEP